MSMRLPAPIHLHSFEHLLIPSQPYCNANQHDSCMLHCTSNSADNCVAVPLPQARPHLLTQQLALLRGTSQMKWKRSYKGAGASAREDCTTAQQHQIESCSPSFCSTAPVSLQGASRSHMWPYRYPFACTVCTDYPNVLRGCATTHRLPLELGLHKHPLVLLSCLIPRQILVSPALLKSLQHAPVKLEPTLSSVQGHARRRATQ